MLIPLQPTLLIKIYKVYCLKFFPDLPLTLSQTADWQVFPTSPCFQTLVQTSGSNHTVLGLLFLHLSSPLEFDCFEYRECSFESHWLTINIYLIMHKNVYFIVVWESLALVEL